eukprot:2152941-Lingulodinium_polyedra.AAC.1
MMGVRVPPRRGVATHQDGLLEVVEASLDRCRHLGLLPALGVPPSSASEGCALRPLLLAATSAVADRRHLLAPLK